MYLDVEAIFSWKSRNSECSKSSKVVSMGWKCAKNGFEIIQKHLEIMFDNKVIIFDHSDHPAVKVEWSELVQVARMVVWFIKKQIIHHITILTTWMGSLQSTFTVTSSKWSNMMTLLWNMISKCFWIISNPFLAHSQHIETTFEDLLHSEFRDFHENIASSSKYNY